MQQANWFPKKLFVLMIQALLYRAKTIVIGFVVEPRVNDLHLIVNVVGTVAPGSGDSILAIYRFTK